MRLCGICGENHCPLECDLVQIVSHITDKTIPSKAKMTVPEDLELRRMADNTYSVAPLYPIEKGTQFGPFQSKKMCSLLPSITFPLKIFSNEDDELSKFCKDEDYLSEYYLDTTNENECNWMMFVTAASNCDEQNAICYQDGENIYYLTTRDIHNGEDIKVWYSPYYAKRMQKEILKPNVSDQNENLGNNECIDFWVQKKSNIIPREIWSCKFCGKTETNVAEFASHLLQHFREQSDRYCPICNKSFLRKQGCESHMKTVHATDLTAERGDQINKKSNTPKKSDKKVDYAPRDNYLGDPLLLNELLNDSMDNTSLVLNSYKDINQLDLSGIENQNNLFENDNLNLNTESMLPENVKGLDNFNFELVPDEAQQFVCDICLKNFKSLRFLTLHMNAHTGKFACFECKKVFARKENIQNHSCARFYKFKCTLCSSLFSQQKYLNFHMKTSHSNKCADCNIQFDTEEKLKDHRCPNTKPNVLHACNQCSKVFTHKNNLIIHKKQHCSRQQGHQYNCPICNKILHSRKTYSKHYKIHEGHTYRCDLCDKLFSRKDTLKSHRDSVHSTLKSDVCEICKKTFKSKKLLSDHMLIHRQNKFQCPHCVSIFKQQKNLTRHINVSHLKGVNNALFLSNEEKPYSCPQCNKKMKFKTSVRRHLERVHSEYKVDIKTIRKDTERKIQTNLSKQAADVEDLKQSLENMDFDTDGINQDHEITIEIDKLIFNNTDNFTSDSNDRLVESLINTAVSENNLDDKCDQRDPMLSMPDLDMDSIHLLSQSKV